MGTCDGSTIKCFKHCGDTTYATYAEQNCQTQGGHLASIHSMEEQNFLINTFNPSARVWIGAVTLTITVCGNGRMGQALTSPTGFLVTSLTEGPTTLSWTFIITMMDIGTICPTPIVTMVTFASSPFKY